MKQENGSIIFDRCTIGLRKPTVRFQLSSGRFVELLSLHFEPGYQFNYDEPRAVFDQVAERIYPNTKITWIKSPISIEGTGFLCLAQFCSDTPSLHSNTANCSYLLVGGFIQIEGSGIHSIATQLLAAVNWEEFAENDFLW